jgi:hypothetical protein
MRCYIEMMERIGVKELRPDACWHPAIQTDGDLREVRGWPRPPA